jgi:DNA modification methylase/ParB-like chromosome segregation protein Spo0J
MTTQVNKSLLELNPLSESIYGEFSLLSEDDAILFASIKNEGILEPLIVTKSHLVISGNRRLRVANFLNEIENVPVIYSEIDDDDVTEYLFIQYNQQRIKDLIQVAREFELIRNHYKIKQGVKSQNSTISKTAQKTLIDDNDTSETTIKRILRAKNIKTTIETSFNDNKSWTDEDSWKWLHKQHCIRKKEVNTILNSLVEEKNEFSNSQNSEKKELLNNDFIHIIHGDSSDMSEFLDDKQVDCIPNSPPYFGAVRTYIQDDIFVKSSTKGLIQTGHEDTVDEYVENLMKTYRECKRVLKDTGSIFINIADTIEDGVIMNIPFHIIEAMKREGFMCVQTIVWYKINPQPINSNSFQPSMEYVLHFVKQKDYKWRVNWYESADEFIGNVTYADGGENKRFRNVMIYYPTNSNSSDIPMYQGLFQTTTYNNTFLVKLLKSKGYALQHNALFPLEVPMICVLSTTEPGDTVLDVFGGMSTTGLIAYANGCKYFGVDKSKVYSAKASIRMEEFLKNNPYIVNSSS